MVLLKELCNILSLIPLVCGNATTTNSTTTANSTTNSTTNTTTVKDRYRPRYHLSPLSGWMNDPNGLMFYEGLYYLFFQHNPNSSLEAGTAHWALAKSSDLFHWLQFSDVLFPNETYDKNGVFSGSALIVNKTIYLYYTANLKHSGETPDHEQRQALAISDDGINFRKYDKNPIVNATEHQPDIRDPKVWEHNGTYYVVLGNSFNNETLGRVLLYSSTDRLNWKQVAVLGKSNGTLGYMWECPDFFELDGKFVLLFSPQGVKADGDKYRNLYQTGYFVGNFNYSTKIFENLTDFQELDHGHDFYATQTTLDKKGSRILIAWFDMWEQNYPEGPDGFTGQMTLPRVLTLTSDLRLVQTPVVEVEVAKGKLIRRGRALGGVHATLDDKAGEVCIKANKSKDLQLYVEGENATVIIKYDAKNGTISLDRGGDDGVRRTVWRPSSQVDLSIFIDASSIEVFCEYGKVTLSSRYFPNGPVTVRLGDGSEADEMSVKNMIRTVSYKCETCK